MMLYVPMAPPTANLTWRRNPRGGMYLSPAMKTFCQLVDLAALNERFKVPEEWRWVDVAIWVSPHQRTGDVDNRIKPVLDALTRAGVWEDDKIVASVTARMVKPSNPTATWIEINEAETPKFADWEQFGLKR